MTNIKQLAKLLDFTGPALDPTYPAQYRYPGKEDWYLRKQNWEKRMSTIRWNRKPTGKPHPTRAAIAKKILTGAKSVKFLRPKDIAARRQGEKMARNQTFNDYKTGRAAIYKDFMQGLMNASIEKRMGGYKGNKRNAQKKRGKYHKQYNKYYMGMEMHPRWNPPPSRRGKAYDHYNWNKP